MNTELLLYLLPGLALFFMLMGSYKIYMEKKVQTQERLEQLVSQKKKSTNRPIDSANPEKILKRRKGKKGEETFTDKLDTALERANLLISVKEFLWICAGMGLAGFLLTLTVFGQNAVISVLSGIGSAFSPQLYIKVRAFLRLRKADAEFADVLDALKNAFKSGYGFNRAVQMICDNFHDPWGTEFGKMAAEMSLGRTQEEALYGLSSRIPLTDVDLFTTAVLIQRETGGSMTELLENLSKTCRDRFKLYQKVGAISAQGKLSAGIIICVPFILAGLMFIFLPEPTLKFYTNPIGIILMSLIAVWMCCGIGVLFKIVQIDV